MDHTTTIFNRMCVAATFYSLGDDTAANLNTQGEAQ